jgi:hypothetical protein
MPRKTPELIEIGISDAALKLHRSYNAVLRLLLTGKLVGRRVGSRWLVDAASVDRYAASVPSNEAAAAHA